MGKSQFVQHFDKRVASFYYYFDKIKENQEIEDIHQLRVSIKKLRVMWSLVQTLSNGVWSQKAQEKLISESFQVAGKIREVQVNLNLTGQFHKKILSAYIQYLKGLEEKYRVELLRSLQEFDIKFFKHLNLELQRQMNEVSDKIVTQESTALILNNAAKIQSASKCKLHTVRKQLKVIQELMGIIRKLNNNGLLELHNQIKSFNLFLGEWHDYRIFLDSLDEFLTIKNTDAYIQQIKNLIQYVEYMQKARQRILCKQLKTDIFQLQLSQIENLL